MYRICKYSDSDEFDWELYKFEVGSKQVIREVSEGMEPERGNNK